MKTVQNQIKNNRPPEMFRPLLWSLRWNDIDVEKDKEDIIINVVNEGVLDHWRWLIKIYGREVIREVLLRRPASEFHPESRELARVMFDLPPLRHAR